MSDRNYAIGFLEEAPMVRNFFAGCIKVQEIKTKFRSLAFEFHPDRPSGNTAIMQEINRQYHAALKGMHETTTIDESGNTHRYYYNESTEQELIDKVNQLLALNLPDIDVTIIGLYIWVTGNTKPVKDQIKSVGSMGYNSKRSCWFYKAKCLSKYRPRYSGKSLDELADKYGSSRYASKGYSRVN